MNCFTNSREHILAALERIDLLIQLQIQHARQRQAATSDPYQGLYFTESEIDALLSKPLGLPRWASEELPLSMAETQSLLQGVEERIASYEAESLRCGIRLRLHEVRTLFQLSSFELDLLLICFALELDLRYEDLYAYLQNDATKKQPSIDLVLNLLSPSFDDKFSKRQSFLSSAPLIKHLLLHCYEDATQAPSSQLSKLLKIDQRIVEYLLDADEPDDRISRFIQMVKPQLQLDALVLPETLKERLCLCCENGKSDESALVFYFRGGKGLGKRAAAEALCHKLNRALMVVDLESLIESKAVAFDTALSLIEREARLQNAAIYWSGFDSLLSDDKRNLQTKLLRSLETRRGLTFLAGEALWVPLNAMHEQALIQVEFSMPTYAQRIELWSSALNGMTTDTLDTHELATRFRLNGGQIYDAVATAKNLARWGAARAESVTMADLYAASRLHSSRNLATLARKITPHFSWSDIVLPNDRMTQLREICNQIQYRSLVYDGWGFNLKMALGKGLNVLFAGPSGTGKTMAADIMASELGLDLYKIDLSGVVSKYIGETEKNLARIFDEAQASNAILFFDEADAIFGKRSEVRDAHDRYANIEVSFLLQKMEEYDGMVILATNLRRNMDEAFVRRIQFTIDFPLPDKNHRHLIWRKAWPSQVPLSQAVDLDFMARQFELSGGNIRNIVLSAAFLAAADGQKVEMAHLIRGTQREYQKMGKIMINSEFGDYAEYARGR